MYLKRIHNVNVGPIEDAEINFSFVDGKPKPVVNVGENGTGKSVLLSNIVDSFYEIASQKFSDARKQNEASEGQQYYKAITTQEIYIGKKFMYSCLEYEHNLKPIHSIFKSGNISFQDFQKEEPHIPSNMNWKNDANYKNTSADEKDANDIFANNVLCYFGPERYEKPNWMGNQYYEISSYEHPSVNLKWNGRLDKPISVTNVIKPTLQWLLDIIVDSRADIDENNGDRQIAHLDIENAETFLQNLHVLGIARKNVEKIMGEISNEDIYFGLNYRNTGGSRFNIRLESNNKMIIPSLDALSTGQSALFNMFATIIRYADSDDINKSIALENITGIVVIDEIDLHLHTSLQRKILPSLLKLFPKVQFIISTHAPLFLLGMDEVYGESGYEIYQMPTAAQISSEKFSEFQRAYSYLAETEKHRADIMDAVQKQQGNPLVITEGATDWKHMKASLNYFIQHEKYSALKFDFLEYEPENSKKENCIKLKMGNTNLSAMCKQISKVRQSRKLIFIADTDDDDTTKALSEKGKPYKTWGNNVFSFVLPLPNSRRDTPKICIEHYYTDDEIKTVAQIGGISRRLYIGNEFNNDGISLDGKLFCRDRNSCGNDSIKIIDGTTDKRVYRINDKEEINIALSKMNFVEKIIEGSDEFSNINFNNFHLIFDTIKQILDEPMAESPKGA